MSKEPSPSGGARIERAAGWSSYVGIPMGAYVDVRHENATELMGLAY